MVLERDLRSNIECSKMSKGKFHSIPQILFSYTSMNHDSDNRLRCPLVFDFVQLDGHFYIEEFLDWLVEIERFLHATLFVSPFEILCGMNPRPTQDTQHII